MFIAPGNPTLGYLSCSPREREKTHAGKPYTTRLLINLINSSLEKWSGYTPSTGRTQRLHTPPVKRLPRLILHPRPLDRRKRNRNAAAAVSQVESCDRSFHTLILFLITHRSSTRRPRRGDRPATPSTPTTNNRQSHVQSSQRLLDILKQQVHRANVSAPGSLGEDVTADFPVAADYPGPGIATYTESAVSSPAGTESAAAV